jgi:hypothetical protein
MENILEDNILMLELNKESTVLIFEKEVKSIEFTAIIGNMDLNICNNQKKGTYI